MELFDTHFVQFGQVVPGSGMKTLNISNRYIQVVCAIGCNTNKVIVINNKYSCSACMHCCWEVHQKSQKGSKDSCKYVCMHCCKYTRSPNQVTKALCSQCTSCGSTKVQKKHKIWYYKTVKRHKVLFRSTNTYQ